MINQDSQNSLQWLTHLNDGLKLSQISFPGTHDSAAYQPAFKFNWLTQCGWKTQNCNFQEQLSLGIRVFDARFQIEEFEKMVFYHGCVQLGKLNEMSDAFNYFLNEHPKQFLILIIRKERGSVSGKKSAEIFETQMAAEYLPLFYSSTIPTVGQIRSKIWVITTNIPVKTFTINTYHDTLVKFPNFWVQNYWSGPQNNKQRAIIEILQQNQPNLIKINFLSQSFGSNMNNKLSKKIQHIIIEQLSIKIIANHYNNFCEKQISKLQQQQSFHHCLGIILMDYPCNNKQLIQKIINNNKKYYSHNK